MSDTPRTDAIAEDMEHLGPGGRELHYGKLWVLARELERENARLLESIKELSRYFTSGNSVPVERAVILAKDFWRITAQQPEQPPAQLPEPSAE